MIAAQSVVSHGIIAPLFAEYASIEAQVISELTQRHSDSDLYKGSCDELKADRLLKSDKGSLNLWKKRQAAAEAIGKAGIAYEGFHIDSLPFLLRAAAFASGIAKVTCLRPEEKAVLGFDLIWNKVQDPWERGGLSASRPHGSPDVDIKYIFRQRPPSLLQNTRSLVMGRRDLRSELPYYMFSRIAFFVKALKACLPKMNVQGQWIQGEEMAGFQSVPVQTTGHWRAIRITSGGCIRLTWEFSDPFQRLNLGAHELVGQGGSGTPLGLDLNYGALLEYLRIIMVYHDKNNDLKSALSSCRAAIEHHPQDARLHFLRGSYAFDLNLTDEARSSWERAVELGDGDASHNLNLLNAH